MQNQWQRFLINFNGIRFVSAERERKKEREREREG